MTIRLGLRLAFAGGVTRMAMMACGIGAGVVLLLFALTAMPALQGRIDRYAWHRTDAATPASAPDPALWLPATDRYAGRNLVRIQVAALGPRTPVPPGVDRLPGPGEVVLSPALADLLRTGPDETLRARFPGRVVGAIRPDGLVSPAELVGLVGREPEQLRAAGAYPIRGVEQPGEPIDLKPVLQAGIALLTVLVVGPVLVFVVLVTRIGAARREQRLAALRLAGATRWQTAVTAGTETAVAAIGGALLGLTGYLAARPIVAARLLFEGLPFPHADLLAPPGQVAAALLGVPMVALGTTLVALHRIQVTPMGVRRRVRRRPPQTWRLIPLGAGIAGILPLAEQPADGAVRTLGVLSPLSILVGLVLAGPLACLWISRAMARFSRGAGPLIAARRIGADPSAAFWAVSGVALAVFAATVVAMTAAGERAAGGNPGQSLSSWSAGLRWVMIFVLLVAACSLTVSTVDALMARRQPFALLRASGVRLGTLRSIALLETGVPLVGTMLGAFGLAMLTVSLAAPGPAWVLPEPGFLLSLAAGVLVALAVPIATWPLMNAVTRIRFE